MIHLGPSRLAIVSVLFVAMCLNAFRRRTLRAIYVRCRIQIAVLAMWIGFQTREVDDQPCRDCLRNGTKPPRQVTTVEFGQPTCQECAEVRRADHAKVLAEAAESRRLLPR